MLPGGFTRGIWLFPLVWRLACAALTNRTIDDELGDSVTNLLPVYMPVGYWNYGPNCTTCGVQPNKTDCYNQTWHDVTANETSPLPYVTLDFTGTAIYVFAVIPNDTVHPQYTTTNLTFTLNNVLVGNFSHMSTSADYEYNVPVYVNKSMPNDQYTLKVEPQFDTLTDGSYFAFDYAIYTFDDGTDTSTTSSPAGTPTPVPSSTPTSAPKNPSHTGAIVGGIIGGGLAVITILALVVFCLRRQNHGDMDSNRQLWRGRDSTITEDADIKPVDKQMSQDFASRFVLASPRPPSPIGSVERSSIADDAPQPQQPVRQVPEMEQTATSLYSEARPGEASSSSGSGTAWQGDRWSTNGAIRKHIEALQNEMERLKAGR